MKENDRRQDFMIYFHERMLSTWQGSNPAANILITSWMHQQVRLQNRSFLSLPVTQQQNNITFLKEKNPGDKQIGCFKGNPIYMKSIGPLDMFGKNTKHFEFILIICLTHVRLTLKCFPGNGHCMRGEMYFGMTEKWLLQGVAFLER